MISCLSGSTLISCLNGSFIVHIPFLSLNLIMRYKQISRCPFLRTPAHSVQCYFVLSSSFEIKPMMNGNAKRIKRSVMRKSTKNKWSAITKIIRAIANSNILMLRINSTAFRNIEYGKYLLTTHSNAFGGYPPVYCALGLFSRFGSSKTMISNSEPPLASTKA